MTNLSELKNTILGLVKDYARSAHLAYRPASDPERTPWAEGSQSLMQDGYLQKRKWRLLFHQLLIFG